MMTDMDVSVAALPLGKEPKIREEALFSLRFYRIFDKEWCPGEDLNLYDISATSPLNWRVYHSTTWAYD